MTSFFAILKDSFREAVDGFVIYAMLALSAVMIVIVGSMSFTPSPPEDAFREFAQVFQLVFAEKGRSRQIESGRASYVASNVQQSGDGYKLRLTARGQTGTTSTNGSKPKPIDEGVDSFRETVAGWARPAGKGKAEENAGRRVEMGGMLSATKDEQKAVTDTMMEEFIKNQFALHAGMDAVVKRVRNAEVEEPSYEFDVTTSGGSSVRGWPHTVKIFFGSVTMTRDSSLGMVLWIIEDQLINGLGSGVALLISMIITSFFIPNMLRKGSIDLLISKPIGRTQLLLYKFVGGLTFIFLLSCVAIGGTWLVLCLRSGIWDPSFLVVIPVLTFTFAILYAVSTLVAVFTRSPIAAMLCSTGFAVFLYIVGQAKTIFDRLKIEQEARGTDNIPEWGFTLVDTLNNVLPRYKDLDKLTSKLIADGTLTPGQSRMTGLAFMEFPSWGGTLGVSLAFIAIMLALSCWRFSKRDY